MKRAFTLIELLIVVLIVGILATVALPQYQKVVEKARGVEAFTNLKRIGDAELLFYMSYGEWACKEGTNPSIGPHYNSTPWSTIAETMGIDDPNTVGGRHWDYSFRWYGQTPLGGTVCYQARKNPDSHIDDTNHNYAEIGQYEMILGVGGNRDFLKLTESGYEVVSSP
ncbi:MAG: pilin [Candidatus Omnitrophica bacterium]|nr:pilin [Candidatus Omnitrophota bacterium]